MNTMVAHQTQVPAKPDWASEPVRLDPALTAGQSIEIVGADGEAVRYQIHRRGAVIRRKLDRSGLPISVAVAARCFAGVAARAMEDAEGNVTVTLELYHPDPALCVPLLVARDLYDVAADWRSWSDLFGLPMMMIEADGSVVPLEDTLTAMRSDLSAMPRRRSPNRTRRPRFLARRKPGGLGMRMVVEGEEIIART
ncbi:hypothetical protein SAMN06297251_13029 [Fulvimarina manganoxydans]|uniref:Uncharacterized protein n=1 Tax=Fulvimarina manganoxydans TaxID=937218 RepID=A0A1W2EQ92_9HYPH|nr:DUF6101 family protein [Fulvimarina manganoxydans]MEE2950115.1 DUF6101 family protein [Pseudomonadota bacterium]SMD11861.1 hypothetical protein SAMN06297251_13029 [Fulvimarina manganoxydans]